MAAAMKPFRMKQCGHSRKIAAEIGSQRLYILFEHLRKRSLLLLWHFKLRMQCHA